MKRIEDIEMMSIEDLEAIADDKSVEIPDSLSARVEDAVLATAVQGRKSRQVSYGLGGLAVAAAAGLLLILASPQQPKDTFDDPMEAYAQLEQTLAYISAKMDKGFEIAAEAEPVFEKTKEVMDYINK